MNIKIFTKYPGLLEALCFIVFCFGVSRKRESHNLFYQLALKMYTCLSVLKMYTCLSPWGMDSESPGCTGGSTHNNHRCCYQGRTYIRGCFQFITGGHMNLTILPNPILLVRRPKAKFIEHSLKLNPASSYHRTILLPQSGREF